MPYPVGKCEFRRWRACDRCGFDYPRNELIQQDGRLYCEGCWDIPDPKNDLNKPEKPNIGIDSKPERPR